MGLQELLSAGLRGAGLGFRALGTTEMFQNSERLGMLVPIMQSILCVVPTCEKFPDKRMESTNLIFFASSSVGVQVICCSHKASDKV